MTAVAGDHFDGVKLMYRNRYSYTYCLIISAKNLNCVFFRYLQDEFNVIKQKRCCTALIIADACLPEKIPVPFFIACRVNNKIVFAALLFQALPG